MSQPSFKSSEDDCIPPHTQQSNPILTEADLPSSRDINHGCTHNCRFEDLESSTVSQAIISSVSDQPEQTDPSKNVVNFLVSPASGRPRHICETCSREFLRPTSLATHMNSHTGQKPFDCPFGCGRQFSASSNARRHLSVHGIDPKTWPKDSRKKPSKFTRFAAPMVDFSAHKFKTPTQLQWQSEALPSEMEHSHESDVTEHSIDDVHPGPSLI